MTAAGDQALLAALRRVVEVTDPVPADWRRVALDCFGWLGHDVAVAQVVYDSTDATRPGGGGAGLRRSGEVRRVGYAAGGGGLEVEMAAGGRGLQVRGRLRPARAGRVRALWRRGSQVAEADATGTFRFDLPARPVSFLVEVEPAVKTGWIVP